MVASGAADSGAARILVCSAVFLAGAAQLAMARVRLSPNRAGVADSCAGFRSCTQERGAGGIRAVCVYAKSVISGFAAVGNRIRPRGAELVGRRRPGLDVFRDLSAS